MRNSFRIQVFLTTSKLCAYIILIIGSVFAFVYQDGGVLLATFSAVSAILLMKTYTTSRTEQKKLEYTQTKPENLEKPDEEIG